MTPHATPQDTLAALRTRFTGELAVLNPVSQQARDARLKLALLEQVEQEVVRYNLTARRVALATLRLLAESAGEAVAW